MSISHLPTLPAKPEGLRVTRATHCPLSPEATVVAIHEQLNRVSYYPAQVARIVAQIPLNGVPEATRSGYELAAYRMPNGSRFVTLSDGSETTWQAYTDECRERSRKASLVYPASDII